nr:DUF2500 family protein [uncultured Catenibacterium sp.]
MVGNYMFDESILCWLKNNRAPVHSIRANVLTKEMSGHKLYVCFGLEDGQMKRFLIDYYAYISLKEGEKGILTYKGNRFIRYDRGGE